MPRDGDSERESEIAALRRRVDELERADTRWRALLDRLPVGVQECDVDGTITYSNRAHARMHGYASSELLGRKVWELPAEAADRDALRRRISELARTQPEPTRDIAVDHTRDGGRVSVQVDWDYLRGPGGELLGFSAALTDVTRSRAVEQALRRSERRFRLLADNLSSVFWIIQLTPEPALVYRSAGMAGLLGRPLESPEEDMRALEEQILESDRARAYEARAQALAGERTEVAFRRWRHDGALRWTSVRSFPVEAGDGTRFIVGLTDDITERKRGELALERARDELARHVAEMTEALRREIEGHNEELAARRDAPLSRRVVDAVPGVVFMVRAAAPGPGRFEFISAGVEPLLGVSPDAVIEDSSELWDRVHAEDVQAVFASLVAAQRASAPWSARFRVLDGRGVTRWAHGLARLGRVPSDGALAWYGVLMASSTEGDAQHRREKLAAIGRLAGGVAHDVNNTLSAILNHVKLLEMDLPRGSLAARSAREIDACARRAADLAKQLLALARERGAETPVVELNQVVGEIVEMYRRIIAPDIELVVALHKGPARVRLDPTKLKQVVMNLIVNARDAMRGSGGRLEVVTDRRAIAQADDGRDSLAAGEYAVLRVSDTGCGIDRAELEHIFEPLFTTKSEGSGLGLATCAEIVRGASGSIEVTSTPGEGATFTVLLPLAWRTAP